MPKNNLNKNLTHLKTLINSIKTGTQGHWVIEYLIKKIVIPSPYMRKWYSSKDKVYKMFFFIDAAPPLRIVSRAKWKVKDLCPARYILADGDV